MNDASVQKHVLLTVLGLDPKPVQYALQNRCVKARLAPIALLDLLPQEQRPHQVLAICTPKAKLDSWPALVHELGDRCPVEAVEVSAGDKQEDANAFLEVVIGAIGTNVDLTVDVTHGFRHFSFLTYVGVLYLAALRGVRVRGAYYGMPNRYAPSPLLNLRPLLELPGWVHALEVLHETGSALPMARILVDGPTGQPVQDNARDLRYLSEAYLSGLPLELGWQAWNIRQNRCKPLRRLLRKDHHLPLAQKLVERLAEILEPFSLNKPISGDGWKRHVPLSKNELKRQAKLIDDLLRRENFTTAIRLMREWVVSWVIFQQRSEDDWLERDVRKKAEGLLRAITAIASDQELRGDLTEEQRSLGCFWGDLREVRNAYAHHGMRRDDLVRGDKIGATRRRVLDFWKQTLRCGPTTSLSLGKSPIGRILVSPVGRRPGVLFSAVKACRKKWDGRDPELCLVICSRDTRRLITEALTRAKFENPIKALHMQDAVGGGQHEIQQVVNTARRCFIGAEEVLVNVTGGTTLMGLAAESLASEARSLACPSVRRFGLIDRRPPGEQENDPYLAGEPFWLDEGDDDADRD